MSIKLESVTDDGEFRLVNDKYLYANIKKLVGNVLLDSDIDYISSDKFVELSAFLSKLYLLVEKLDVHIYSAMYVIHFLQFRAALFLLRHGLTQYQSLGIPLGQDENESPYVELSAQKAQVYACQFEVVLKTLRIKFKTNNRQKIVTLLRQSNFKFID